MALRSHDVRRRHCTVCSLTATAVATQGVRRADRKGENGGGLWIGRAVTAAPETGPVLGPSRLLGPHRRGAYFAEGCAPCRHIPGSASKPDAETLGLWNMDAGTAQGVPDLSGRLQFSAYRAAVGAR